MKVSFNLVLATVNTLKISPKTFAAVRNWPYMSNELLVLLFVWLERKLPDDIKTERKW